MKEIIVASVLFLISALAIFMSVRSFMQRGFLLNNAYIYATEKEREQLDKAPHYRQTGVVLLLIALVFALNGASVLIKAGWMLYVEIAVIVAAIVYAIISSVAIEKAKENKK